MFQTNLASVVDEMEVVAVDQFVAEKVQVADLEVLVSLKGEGASVEGLEEVLAFDYSWESNSVLEHFHQGSVGWKMVKFPI